MLKMWYEVSIGLMFASCLMMKISLTLEVNTIMICAMAGTALLGRSGDMFPKLRETYAAASVEHR